MNGPVAQEQGAVTSPCVGICRLDGQEVCVGCGRLIDEIVEWSRATESRRRLIVNLAAQRMQGKKIGNPT